MKPKVDQAKSDCLKSAEDSGVNSPPNEELREKAEKIAKKELRREGEKILTTSKKYDNNILHDLRVHQIELELQNEALRNSQNELEAIRSLYFEVYELAPVGYLLVSKEGIIQDANITSALLLGFDKNYIKNKQVYQFIARDDRDIFYLFSKKLYDSSETQICEVRMLKSTGEIFWANFIGTPRRNINAETIYLMVLYDITDRVVAQEYIKEQEKLYQMIADNSTDVIWVRNMLQNKFTYVSPSIKQYKNISPEETLAEIVEDTIMPELVDQLNKKTQYAPQYLIDTPIISDPIRFVFQQIDRNGNLVWVESSCIFRYKDNHEVEIVGISRNIDERKLYEQKLEDLSYHDMMTGLYNRRFMDEEIRRLDTIRNLPISIIVGDVNRLKLINDAFGHEKGDELLIKVANTIKSNCRPDDLLARTGGDEFMLFLPKTSADEASKIVERIQEDCSNQEVNSISISISLGIAEKASMDYSTNSIILKAEKEMYRQKTAGSERHRKDIIIAVMDALYKKEPMEQKHAAKVSALCKKMAVVLRYNNKSTRDLVDAGLMHDIGKVAISVEILDKPDALSRDEWEQIKKHSEIGYFVVGSSEKTEDIANAILAHHEQVDGNGYPKGLKGPDIPVSSKIISLADSFISMTSETPYRKPMTKEEAIKEIRKNKGIQFDSVLAELFIEKVLLVQDTFMK